MLSISDPIAPLNVTPEDELVELLKEYNMELKGTRCLTDLNKFLLYDLPRIDLTKKRPVIESEDDEEDENSASM